MVFLLSPDVQKAVQAAANKAVEESINKADALAKKYIDKLAKTQKEVFHPDLKPFIEAVQPTYDAFGKKTGTMRLLEQVKEMVK